MRVSVQTTAAQLARHQLAQCFSEKSARNQSLYCDGNCRHCSFTAEVNDFYVTKATLPIASWLVMAMLQSLAKEFAEEKFGNQSGVIGVLLVGSASFDCVDRLSDIDLEIVATHDLYSKVARTREGFEQFKDVEITWEWMTLEEFENQLKDWRDDIDLWVYSRSKILLDPEHKIEDLLARYRRYRRAVWLEKLFLYWYFATANAPYDSGKAIQRGDLLTAQMHLVQAMEYYTSLIFILNKSFVPYRKWRLKELSKLSYKPQNYEENLRMILTVQKWSRKQLETKQNIVNELTKSLESKLLEAGVSRSKLENPWRFKVSYVPRV